MVGYGSQHWTMQLTGTDRSSRKSNRFVSSWVHKVCALPSGSVPSLRMLGRRSCFVSKYFSSHQITRRQPPAIILPVVTAYSGKVSTLEAALLWSKMQHGHPTACTGASQRADTTQDPAKLTKWPRELQGLHACLGFSKKIVREMWCG